MESKMFVIFVACFGLIDTNIIRGPQIRPSDRACSRYKAQYQELALKAQYSNWLKITGPPKNTRPSRVSFLDNSINNEKPTIVFRIIGEVADEDEFPHMAAVGWSRVISPYKPSYQYLCGGTLISESFILTAAHCKFANNHKSRGLKSPEPNVVKLGQNYLNMPSLVIEIEAIIPHELYKSPNKYYDIALFRLKDKVEFCLNVMPACLSGKMVAKGVATGWGATQSGRLLKSQSTNNLHKATVDIVDPKLCNDVLANHNWLYGLADHQMCAGDLDMKGRDTCQGDSGSPLQYKRDQDPLYYILGVTSFGSKNCGQHPAVYTRVSSFLPWIESIVWPAATVRNDIPSELIWL